jgi:hypothetical protein
LEELVLLEHKVRLEPQGHKVLLELKVLLEHREQLDLEVTLVYLMRDLQFSLLLLGLILEVLL